MGASLPQDNLACSAPCLVSKEFKCVFWLWVQPCTAVSTGANHGVGREVKWLLKRSVAVSVQNCTMVVRFDKFVQNFAWELRTYHQHEFRDCCTTIVTWHRHTYWHFWVCCVVYFSLQAPHSCMVNLCPYAQSKPGAPGQEHLHNLAPCYNRGEWLGW